MIIDIAEEMEMDADGDGNENENGVWKRRYQASRCGRNRINTSTFPEHVTNFRVATQINNQY